ncbi:hypothetical protein MCHI_002051 [Candidatus Magnetoovum chiemensis]|nr:hypothetical protein MCHI_002051 [Candidatus Magnetoovum chiemensis]
MEQIDTLKKLLKQQLKRLENRRYEIKKHYINMILERLKLEFDTFYMSDADLEFEDVEEETPYSSMDNNDAEKYLEEQIEKILQVKNITLYYLEKEKRDIKYEFIRKSRYLTNK